MKLISRLLLGSAAAMAGAGAFPIGAAAQPVGETIRYDYDELGRLVATEHVGGVNAGQARSLCYDPAGNRTIYKSSSAGALADCTSLTATSAGTQAPSDAAIDSEPGDLTAQPEPSVTGEPAQAPPEEPATEVPDQPADAPADAPLDTEPVESATEPESGAAGEPEQALSEEPATEVPDQSADAPADAPAEGSPDA